MVSCSTHCTASLDCGSMLKSWKVVLAWTGREIRGGAGFGRKGRRIIMWIIIFGGNLELAVSRSCKY